MAAPVWGGGRVALPCQLFECFHDCVGEWQIECGRHTEVGWGGLVLGCGVEAGRRIGLRQIWGGPVEGCSEIHNFLGRIVEILHKLNEAIRRQIGHRFTETFN